MSTDEQQELEHFRQHELEAWLSQIALGERVSVGSLDIFPLIAPVNGAPRYRLLHEGVAAKEIEVVEKSGGATVPEVETINRGTVPVLILEGDLLVGSKQNRMVVHTILVPAGATRTIRVGCVERGRWDFRQRPFEAGDFAADTSLRKETLKDVLFAMKSRGVPAADQAALWMQIADKLNCMNHYSPTSDYHSSIRAYAEAPEQKPLPTAPVPGQVGVVALRQGRLLGIELVGHPETWRSAAERRLRSYAFTADLAEMDPKTIPEGPCREPEEWLRFVRHARVFGTPSPGMGEDLSLEGEGILGAGLWCDRHPVHLAVFED
jgi:hypothetical protein